MISLIPPEGYRILKHEYFLRVSTVYCFLFSAVFILVTIAQVPMYVLVDAQIKSLEYESLQTSGVAEVTSHADEVIKATNNILVQLNADKKPFLVSAAIAEIQKVSPTGISFKSFVVGTSNVEAPNIQVQGVATTRGKLAELKTSVESSELFHAVEIPIADLAKDSELPFTITILPNK